MSAITIYHGSSQIVEHPIQGVGNPHNDYGLGFYCTESEQMAMEWACSARRDGFANKYSLDACNLETLYLKQPQYHILNWLAILLENRGFECRTPIGAQAKDYILETFLPDYTAYDLIVGYRADDSYFSFARAFLENGISLEQLQRAMQLGELGEQIVVRSQAAFERLRFISSTPVDSGIYYARRIARDRLARQKYQEMLAETPAAEAVYAVDILRQKWQNNDERLL